MARPIPAVTLPALAVCADLSGCAGTPGPDATPVRTASARINATTVAQPDPSAPVAGWTRFAEMKDGSVRVTAELRHLKPGGAVGFHIHDKGDCSGDGNAAGGHFNPTGAMHGAPGHGHAGDLPMLQADAQGTATVRYTSQQIKLEGEGGILGRAVIVHRDLDDQHTQPTGNAGPRLACGVIMTGG